MYVCMCVYIYIYTYTHVCVYTHTCVYIYIYIYVYVYIYIYTNTHVTHICIYIYIYIYVCVCVYNSRVINKQTRGYARNKSMLSVLLPSLAGALFAYVSYVYIYIYIYTLYVYIYIYIYIYIYTHLYLSLSLSIYIYIYTYNATQQNTRLPGNQTTELLGSRHLFLLPRSGCWFRIAGSPHTPLVYISGCRGGRGRGREASAHVSFGGQQANP